MYALYDNRIKKNANLIQFKKRFSRVPLQIIPSNFGTYIASLCKYLLFTTDETVIALETAKMLREKQEFVLVDKRSLISTGFMTDLTPEEKAR